MGTKFARIRYDGSEEIFDVTIKDGTGRNIGRWTFMKRDFGKWAKIMRNQYGLKIYIKDFSEDRDLDWAQ